MGAVFFAPLPTGGYAARESDSSDPRAGFSPLPCNLIARGRVATERLGVGSTLVGLRGWVGSRRCRLGWDSPQQGPAGSAMAKRRQAAGSGFCECLQIRGRCGSHRTAPILGRESGLVSTMALAPGEGWTGCTPQQPRLVVDLHGHPRTLGVPVTSVGLCLARRGALIIKKKGWGESFWCQPKRPDQHFI
jgi:hypothetical protein